MPEKNKILCVDDEENVLAGFRRQLRKDFLVETCSNPHDALKLLEKDSSYAVLLSDMQMPQCSGTDFLRKAKKLSPDTVRVMLTGNNDQGTAAEAVNKGEIFRFLNKPCQKEDLIAAIQASIEQHRLIRLEKELLNKTLMGSVQALFDVLSMTNPFAFSQTVRLQDWTKKLGELLGIENRWQLEIATMLGNIGCLTIPVSLLKKDQAGEDLNMDEKQMLHNHVLVTKKLLKNIPRLEEVAEIISLIPNHLEKDKVIRENTIFFTASIIQAAKDFDQWIIQGKNFERALLALKESDRFYHPEVLEALSQIKPDSKNFVLKTLSIGQLRPNMILAEDLNMKSGMLLAPEGFKLNGAICQRLLNFAKQDELDHEEIKVKVAE